MLEAANLLPNEQVHIWNVTNGNRLITYTLLGERDSGTICINGAGAHLMQAGDIVIIAAFAQLSSEEARLFIPKVILVDSQNKIIN